MSYCSGGQAIQYIRLGEGNEYTLFRGDWCRGRWGNTFSISDLKCV